MCTYVPVGLPANRPLVVALHGCAQEAADYGISTGWTKLADEYQFGLVLPKQIQGNQIDKCFSWYEPNDVKRHDASGATGELASIWAMIQKMQTDYHTSPDRVYITGLSAGGAMTAAALAAYPEVSKGGAIIAGVPYGCAETQGEGHDCMDGETDLSPEEWGKRVRAAAQGHVTGDGVPVVSIWHGRSDGMVNKVTPASSSSNLPTSSVLIKYPTRRKPKATSSTRPTLTRMAK